MVRLDMIYITETCRIVFRLNMKKIVLLASVLLLSLAVVAKFISPVVSYSAETELLMEVDLPVHNVDSGKNFSTIQEAINDNETLDGHTILADEGTYHEHVVVNKSVSLISENKYNTVFDGNLTGTVMNVTASNVNITGFTIQKSGYPNCGIYVGEWSAGNNISYNIITNNWCGIWLNTSSNSNISGNNITNNYLGIYLYESSKNIISNNIVSSSNYEGIYLSSSSGNIVYGNTASNNSNGILFTDSSNNVVSGNDAFNNAGGIWLSRSGNCTISGNNVSNNTYGICLQLSGNNTLFNNTMTGNTYNFGVKGETGSDFDNSVDVNNIVDGRPVFYLKDVTDTVYNAQTNAGTIYLIACDNITIKDLTLTKNWHGVFLWNTTNSKIENVTASNNIAGGIWLSYSCNCTVSGNTVSKNGCGISLYSSSNNTVSDNTASNNTYGINNYGIYLVHSSNNVISGNNVSNNIYGINLYYSDNNVFSQNNFVDNFKQVHSYNSVNVWDGAGKGNYWSDYEEKYPDAEEIDGSSIWDTPYVIDENNQDNYPIVPEFPTWTSILLILILLTVAIVIHKRKPLKTSIQ